VPTPAPRITDPVAPKPGALYFWETGHNVSGLFLTYFERNGGLARFGYPRTEEITEDGRTVQYFQRARLEHHPEHAGTPYEVQLTLLGDLLTQDRQPFPPAPASCSPPGCRYFPETRHRVVGAFLKFFESQGGLDQFGYPISEEGQEENGDGTGRKYTVQWFQRARLEYHPELGPDAVLLGLVGDEHLRRRGLVP